MQSPAQQHYAALLRTAEAGVDDIERLLGVARMMLSFCTDMLCNRSDKEPALTLDDILETHHVNTFPVGTAGEETLVCPLLCHSTSSPWHMHFTRDVGRYELKVNNGPGQHCV